MVSRTKTRSGQVVDRFALIRRAAVEALESRQLMSATTQDESLASQSAIVMAAEVSQPSVTSVSPANQSTGFVRDGFISAEVSVPNGGIKANTMTASTVFLKKTSNNVVVPAILNTSGGGDVIILRPTGALEANTSYTFTVTSGLQDNTGVGFVPFTSTFTTGTGTSVQNNAVKFEKVQLSITNGEAYTSLAMGPDNKLYAATIDGEIYRWAVNADGTLASEQIFDPIAPGTAQRFITGILFDPASTASNPILWVNHSDHTFDNATNWTSKLTKLSDNSSGTDLAKVEDKIVGLPRSAKDHLNNQMAWGPDGALYFNQGAQSAMGAPDAAWGNRQEELLSAAILRLDPAKLGSTALNVKTRDGGTYNPYASGAALTIYATGVRNAYDLVWHSNGHLYVPTNGSAANGNTPAGPGGTPRALSGVSAQNDYLFDVQPGKYYGHPNPLRGEYVLNGGNPTSSTDPAQVGEYPVGTTPPANYGGFAYNFGLHASPNGAIEYKSDKFNGALQGKLLVVRYSGQDDMIALVPTGIGNGFEATGTIQGFTGFYNPLDVVEDTRYGNLYVAEFGPEDSSDPAGGQRITLLRPVSASSTTAVTTDIGTLTGQAINSNAAGSLTKPTTSTVRITAGGANIDDFADGFYFAHQERAGDFDLRVRVDSIGGGTTTSKAGIMARAGLGGDAVNVFQSTTSGSTFRLSYRETPGADTTRIDGPTRTMPGFLRLVREGNTFIGYHSTNGTTWTETGRRTMANMPPTVNVGLAASSARTTTTPITANFSQLASVAPVAKPTVGIAATDAAAAESGADNTATYTVTRSGATTSPLVVKYTVSGTAINGTDYAALSGTVTIPAGASAATIVLAPTNDNAAEGAETAVLTLTADAAYDLVAPLSATATIDDNGNLPPTVSVAATTANAAENGGAAGVFTFTRSGPTTGDLIVSYTVAGGAGAGTDYAALSGTVTIPAGLSSATVTVTGIDDAAVEGNETVAVTVAAGAGYVAAAGAPGTATVTIVDDDAPPAPPTVTVAALDAQAAEAGSDAGVYRITRSGSTSGALSVLFNFSGSAVGGTDFAAAPALTSVTIPDGASFADVTITPVDDSAYDPSETAVLTIAANGAYVVGAGAGSASVTIADNDAAPVQNLTGININVRPSGSSSAITGGYQVTAGGPNLSGSADGFRFMQRTQTGNFDVSVRVESLTGTNSAAKAGIMARESLTATSRHASAIATKADGFRAISRVTTNGTSNTTFNSGTPDYATGVYLRLKREGNVFTSFYSTNGTNWTQMSASTVVMPSTIYLGLATTSAMTTSTATARYLNFANYSQQPPTQTELPAPANLDAQAASPTQVNLSWGAVAGATSYHVQRRVVGQSAWTDVADVTTTSYQDAGRAPETAYEYQVNATDGTRVSAYSNVDAATTPPDTTTHQPETPEGLTAQGVSTSQIDVSWNGHTHGDLLFRVQYKLASAADSAYVDLGTTADEVFSITGLPANTAYTVRVRGEEGGLTSAWVTANANTLAEAQLAAPGGVTATPQTNPTRVVVGWSAVAGATGYRVQRKLAGQSDLSFADVGLPTAATTLTDSGVADGTAYVYRVRAEKAGNLSPYSDPVNAQTAAAAIPSTDINTSPAGSTTSVPGGYDVTTYGLDIYGTADSFRFLNQQRTGDFDVRVRIDSFTAPLINAKAGLMARENLNANSRNVFSGISESEGYRFGARTTTGGTTSNIYKVGTVVDGAWVRLKRAGNTFTGYFSTNGTSWTQMGTSTISMPSTVYLGLAQTSKSSTQSSTAQYRDYGNTPAAPAAASISWASGPSVPVGLAEAGSIQIGDKLYVFGGYASGLIGRYENRVLDLDTGQWTTLSPMRPNSPITHFGAATDGKFIYVVGGQAGNGGSTDIRSESWKYNIATDTWTSFTALPAARGGGGLALVGDELHFFSGFTTDRITHATDHWAIRIDANGNPVGGWVTKAPVPLSADHFGIAEVGGIIYLIGGEDSHGQDYNQHRTMQAYDPATNTWQQRAQMPVASSHFEGGVQVINGRIIVLGGMGANESIINDGRVYDPASNTWSDITDLPYGRKGGISAWYNNKLYYATGNGFNGGTTKAYQTNGWYGTINNLWPAPQPQP